MDTSLLGCLMFAKRCYAELSFLRQAFADDMLSTILQEIGQVEYIAAIDALNSAKISNDPPQLVREAVTHLRSAYWNFICAGEKRRLFGLLRATPSTRSDAYEAALEALLFMAVCYRFVSDYDNAIDVLNLAESTVSSLEEAWIDQYREDVRWINAGYSTGLHSSSPRRQNSKIEIAEIRKGLAEIKRLTQSEVSPV
jgi:hypothetical protein